MAIEYPAVIEGAEDGFGISFPDFPGCVSFADSFAGVGAAGREALSLHIQGMLEDGISPPPPSPAGSVSLPRHAMAAIAMVPVDVRETRQDYIRVNLTLPAVLLREIDRVAHGNRSGWIAAAAAERLRRDPLIGELGARVYRKAR